MRRALVGLLAADVVSTAGSEMTAVALPWFVLVTTGSAGLMGAVLAAEFAGLAVLGLWGGPAATRLGARRAMLGSDAVRALLVGLVPLLHAVGALSLPVLLGLAFAVGGFFPGYSSAQRIVLAGLVDDDEVRLTRIGGLLGAVNETASFVGPALGGVLVVLLGAPSVLAVDAGSYLCACALVATLVPPVPAPPPEPDQDGGIRPGLRYLAADRALRHQVAGIAVLEVGWCAMIATLPVLALHHGGSSVAGWLLGAFGAGSVVGGLLATRTRDTGGRIPRLAVLGMAASMWLLVLPVPVWARALAVAGNGVCNGLFFPRFFSALTARTPPRLRARVLTVVTTVISAPGAIGFLGAGLLAQQVGGITAGPLLAAVATTLGAAVAAPGLTPSAPSARPDRSGVPT